MGRAHQRSDSDPLPVEAGECEFCWLGRPEPAGASPTARLPLQLPLQRLQVQEAAHVAWPESNDALEQAKCADQPVYHLVVHLADELQHCLLRCGLQGDTGPMVKSSAPLVPDSHLSGISTRRSYEPRVKPLWTTRRGPPQSYQATTPQTRYTTDTHFHERWDTAQSRSFSGRAAIAA